MSHHPTVESNGNGSWNALCSDGKCLRGARGRTVLGNGTKAEMTAAAATHRLGTVAAGPPPKPRGPWVVGPTHVKGPYRESVNVTTEGVGFDAEPIAIVLVAAMAPLVAAAPRLLEECQRAAYDISHGFMQRSEDEVEASLRSAIAAAKGPG